MGSFGNVSKIIENAMYGKLEYNFKDKESARKEVLHLFSEGVKHYSESKRQMVISKELTIKALMLSVHYDLIEEFGKMKSEIFIERIEEEMRKNDKSRT